MISNRPTPALLACAFALVFFQTGCAHRGDYSAGSETASSGGKNPRIIESWQEIKQRNTVIQRFDYSCGAAAMATLLTYYFGDEVSEVEVLKDILESIGEEKLKETKEFGLSLLDLQQYAVRHGYQAMGVKIELEALEKLKGPILVYLETEEYRHFAIFRGIVENRVFLADPSWGNLRLSIDDFSEQWPNIALVLGKKGFGTPSDYPLAVETEPPVQNEIKAARNAIYRGF